MSGKIKCMMSDGPNYLGKKDPSGETAHQLSGAGIVIKHCNIKYDTGNNTATIYPNEEDP
jgi:hypothetical protein